MELTIIKKNRKYFACTKDDGYKCSLLIDANSENIYLGRHILDVEDISIVSKYGTKTIYKLKSSANEHEKAAVCFLRAEYNSILVDECRKLGGTWDSSAEVWVFSSMVEDEVEELENLFTSNIKTYELCAMGASIADCGPIIVFGINIGSASGRDSGACQSKKVAFIEGGLDSGGSRKNWTTVLESGSVFRMRLPAGVVDKYEEKNLSIEEIKD